MQQFIAGVDVWAELGPRFRRARGRRQAAVAFASSAAYDLLGLRDGDAIVVNAGVRALRLGATDPTVLERWIGDGVQVFNHRALHAKVLVTPKLAAVGSANASYAAQGHSNEAVLVSGEADVVGQVRRYVDSLAAEAFEVHEDGLEQLKADYRPPRGAGLTGITSRAPASPLIPDGKLTMHVAWATGNASAVGVEHFEQDRRRIPRQRGLALDFYETSRDDAERWDEKHLLLVVWDDGDGEVANIGRISQLKPRRSWTNVYYHYVEGAERPLGDVLEALRGAGYRWTGDDASITDQGKITPILQVWGLDAGITRA